MKIPRHRFFCAAFSLPEVTMAMGIVAVLLLPTLAMLAGGSSMERLARNRDRASRIVREVVAGVRPGTEDDHFLLDFSGWPALRLDSPAEGAGNTVCALFDGAGLYLGEVSEEQYKQGIDPSGGGVHLARFRLSAAETAPESRLLEWELSVGQPAAAGLAGRDVEIFQTLLSRP